MVPTGPLRGQPFRIPEWQREYVRVALADGVREAGLSVARKNGKSGASSRRLALAHLCGPLNAEYWRGLVVSLTGGLAKELRDAVQFTAEASGLADRSITCVQVTGSGAHRGAQRGRSPGHTGQRPGNRPRGRRRPGHHRRSGAHAGVSAGVMGGGCVVSERAGWPSCGQSASGETVRCSGRWRSGRTARR